MAAALSSDNTGLGLTLRRPPLTYGTGSPMNVVTNHFLVYVECPPHKAVWVTWQVEWPGNDAAKGKGEKGAEEAKGKGKGRDKPGGAGRVVRAAAMDELLKDMDKGAWVYDGAHRLYTLKDVQPPTGESAVTLSDGKPPLPVTVLPAMGEDNRTQQELDLQRLLPRNLTNQPDAYKEELRFLQVAMRSYAGAILGKIARGRRVVDPDSPLTNPNDFALMHGRQLWTGYLANLEVIDDGNINSPGARTSLSLNFSASVGLPEMPALEMLAHLLAEQRCRGRADQRSRDFWYYKQELERNTWPRDMSFNFVRTLNSEAGLRKLKCYHDYLGYRKKSQIVGISEKPADQLEFWLEKENRYTTVTEYFYAEKWMRLQYGALPCLMLGRADCFVPIELVKILGGEHNLIIGKLKPEYQKDVSRLTAVDPPIRRNKINSIIMDPTLSPQYALQEKGITMERRMLKLQAHQLPPPTIVGANNQQLTAGRYASDFKSAAPPKDWIEWGLWSFTGNEQRELQNFARQFADSGSKHGLYFNQCKFVDRPRRSYGNEGAPMDRLKEMMLEDLKGLSFEYPQTAVLLVVNPTRSPGVDKMYKILKMLTETEYPLTTQCIVAAGNDLGKAALKFNNIMVKIAAKIPADWYRNSPTAHNVRLGNPHWLLTDRAGTMVIGADVSHNAAGVSVAGVVATKGADFATYFSEVRAQSPFELGVLKKRQRKAEERILALSEMVGNLLWRWQDHNAGRLPEHILFYRDGVSDGQFQPVLTRELNMLAEACIKTGGNDYRPKLVVIVGQKRHQTRFFLDDGSDEKGYGKGDTGYKGGDKGGKGDKGKGKGKSKDHQIPPGTVVSRGIAAVGHLNFFMVSHQGIKGTSIPCHYHVLHCDSRLQVNASDIEEITYQLCHLYSRADKVVSYASPAYLADHLAERGKLHLEVEFPDMIDDGSTAGPGSSQSSENPRYREEVERRVNWFNNERSWYLCNVLQGRHFFT